MSLLNGQSCSQPPTRVRRLSPRNDHHANPPSATALQGAVSAFHASPPEERLPVANHRSGISAMGSTRHRDHPPVSLLDSDSDPPPPELPEPGSIKNKIAIFSGSPSTQGRDNAVKDVPVIRAKPPQQLAAQLAVTRSPTPSSRRTGVDVHRVPSERNEQTTRRELPAPIPIRKPLVNRGLIDASLGDRQVISPANAPVEQKLTSPIAAVPSQPSVSKRRPVPPVPRKPISSGRTSTDSHLEHPKGSEESLSGRFPHHSNAPSSTLSEERSPALPPRRAATEPINDVRGHQLLAGGARSPWPSSSSAASLYSQSQNNTSTSIPEASRDGSKEGPSEAVMASSLASSRALQEKKSPPPPPPHRRRRSRSLLHQHRKDRLANPSPGSLRETLRTRPRSDDEEDHHRRHLHGHIIHKHPHKHHEGDRRRWRSEVSEKERKRYEGVWAANKGLLIPPSQVVRKEDSSQGIPVGMYPPDALEMVVNIVAQDIWSRSRLPNHVLEQIWGLVDRQQIGLLTREEFVVGMWLVDQRLRGHKLPVVVPDSVWASVRRVPGISLDDLR